MLKVLVEGQMEQVQPFLSDLKQRSQIELLKNEIKENQMEVNEGIRVVCYVDHKPERRVKTIKLHLADGTQIQLPLMDLIEVEMEKGVRILAGRSYDIFA
ncbi:MULTISPECIES: hypothetical protein [Thermoactinomyces]|jgi:predicted RNA-binding protein (virulence factor B family)|uniref:Uncharacterized protein n=1 Tax=Thermoactinomyces daqus TaxID=1329516 RepID=A0A7W2AHF1_9BACL|nr:MULTISPECIES: hypothetical protein [Thermoactinomyces]MBA4541634.1 hypothetical protein [Thermoactinomyces daqus]MBH8597630.1 hypothetical protein [Thermoactinomyces sp. CICC 10523]MBH8603971.1 hypothetical protein [Thermoactinomyces sp. CICC 10522]MBH8606495.1 hypothetical protein [Thermoactinomyces sp. CICC 10521]